MQNMMGDALLKKVADLEMQLLKTKETSIKRKKIDDFDSFM